MRQINFGDMLLPLIFIARVAGKAIMEIYRSGAVDFDGRRLHDGKRDTFNPFFIATRDLALIPK